MFLFYYYYTETKCHIGVVVLSIYTKVFRMSYLQPQSKRCHFLLRLCRSKQLRMRESTSQNTKALRLQQGIMGRVVNYELFICYVRAIAQICFIQQGPK